MNLTWCSIPMILSLYRRFCRQWLCALGLLLGAQPAALAVLTIEVNRGVEAAIPIAVVPFATEGTTAVDPGATAVIESDLSASGHFEVLDRADFISQPHNLDSIQYKDWRLLKAEALVIGKIIAIGNGQYEVRFRLIDVFREQQLAGQKFITPVARLRQVLHQISDIIYLTLTGKPGVFDTNIAYVSVQGRAPQKRFLLQIADSDGYAPKTVLESSEPVLSPTWSPTGDQLAYVSFEQKRSMVFTQNIRTGKRKRIAEFTGINSAPKWSPDGRHLALTLSKDGNPEIYIYALATARWRRITRHTAIDTEPAWSPDGSALIFTSGRSGTPQIYRVVVDGGQPQRLTFDGVYNAAASYSADGKYIVMITNQGNGYRVGLYSVATRTVTELTRGQQEESPSFAPNGEIIIYTAKRGGRDVLATVSIDGRVQQTLELHSGSVREPTWSPYNRKL